MAATREHRNQASQRFDQEQERKKQRELRESSFLGTAAAATRDAFEASTRREKTLIEEVDDWGAEYRSTKASVESAQLSASFAAEHQAALMQKQMDLPIASSNVHIPQPEPTLRRCAHAAMSRGDLQQLWWF